MNRVFKVEIYRLVIFVALLSYSPPLHAELADMIAAKVNDKIILLSDIRMRMAQTINPEKLKTLAGKTRSDVEKRILDQLIEEKMLASYALRLGINVDEELIRQNIEAIKKSNNMADWQLEEALKKEGITIDEYQEILKEQRLISLVINREVTSQVFVDEKEVRSFYENNPDKYMTEEEVHIRHIFVKTPENSTPEQEELAKSRIEDISKRLKNGEDFGRLAKLYSEDTTASSGGDLGFFVRGKMVEAFEEVAFRLRPGDISDVVKTGFGFHIINCIEKKSKRSLTFDEAKELVKNNLFGQKVNAKKTRLIEKLKKGITVEKKI